MTCISFVLGYVQMFIITNMRRDSRLAVTVDLFIYIFNYRNVL